MNLETHGPEIRKRVLWHALDRPLKMMLIIYSALLVLRRVLQLHTVAYNPPIFQLVLYLSRFFPIRMIPAELPVTKV